MKSPRTPPQSATREPKENASSSLLTVTVSLANAVHSSVLPVAVTCGSCGIYFKMLNSCFIAKILYRILHECAWHQAFCVFKYFTSDHATYSLILWRIFSQKLQIITQGQPYHIKSSPWWHASSIPHDVFHYTLSQAVLWIWFTWIVRQIQFLMLYDLQYAICDRILAI